MSRPSWDAVWMQVARVIAQRSTCPRASVGAVVVSWDNRLLSTGYNGAPAGTPHCADVGCLCGPDGGCVRSVHAEVNALYRLPDLSAREAELGTLYVTMLPCYRCSQLLVQSGIKRLVYADSYRPEPGLPLAADLLRVARVAVVKLD